MSECARCAAGEAPIWQSHTREFVHRSFKGNLFSTSVCIDPPAAFADEAGWVLDSLPGVYPHARPVKDRRDHPIDHRCWCGPVYEGGVWVHRALDGRVAYERAV